MVEESDDIRSPPVRELRGDMDSQASPSLSNAYMSSPLQSSSASHIVEDCRRQLSDLRKLVKEVRTHKTKSIHLLSQASDLVVKLDEVIYSRSLDVYEKEHLIHRLGPKALLAMDKAESLLRKYGNMSSLGKLKNSILTSSAVQQAFDRVGEEITNISYDTGQAATTSWQAPASLPHTMEQQQVAGLPKLERGLPTKKGDINAPTSPKTLESNSSDLVMSQMSSQVIPPALSTALLSQDNSGTRGHHSKTDGVVTITNLDHTTLQNGSRQSIFQAAESIAFDWNNEDAMDNFLWISSSRLIGSDRLNVINISQEVSKTVHVETSVIQCMHYDTRGVMWTGHKNGHVTAWNVHSQKPFCKSIKVSSGVIKTITSDEAGTAWCGSDKGDVRRLTLSEQTTDGGEILGYELVVLGQLKDSGTGSPDISASHPVDSNGMVVNHRAKEKAHNGPVFSVLAAAGRVWTAGGTPAFLCFKEWTQRGEFMIKKDLKVTGAIVAMKLISPFVLVKSHSAGLSTVTSMGGSDTSPGVEVRQQYQVLMGYANGTVGVWGPVNGVLCQILRIGRRCPPVTGLAVVDDLGMIITSHLDGKLRLRVPPRAVDKDRLLVMYTDKTVSSVNLNLVEIATSDYGDSIVGVYAHKQGVSYVTANGTARYLSNDLLVETLQQSGHKNLRGLGNKLCNCTPDWASKSLQDSQSYTSDDSFALKTTSLFPQDAFQWMIDYSDLVQTKVIGEGAFGKVYLGKWHETDVAIKALTSLGALGIAAGKVASYATEADVKDALKTLEREVGLMVGMRHPNVILFLGVCPDPPCVVTEYCSRGSLYDVLLEAKENPMLARSLTWYRRVNMMLDAAKGMLYLHSHKPTIIHRDLKSPNLLVDGNWTVKVTDFNLSRLADVAAQPGVTSSVVANNPRWHAPEIIRDALFTKPGDVYAFGLIMWEMISWELPFDGLSSFQMILFIGDKAGRPDVPSEDETDRIMGGFFSGYKEYVELMVHCWDQDPEKRPEFPEIISKLRSILATFPEFGGYSGDQSAEEPPSREERDTQNLELQTTSPQQIPVQRTPSPFDAPLAATNQTAGGFDTNISPFDAPASAPDAPAPLIVSPFDTVIPTIESVPQQEQTGMGGRSTLIDSVSETRQGRIDQ